MSYFLRVLFRENLEMIRIKWRKRIFNLFVRTSSLFEGFLVESYLCESFWGKSRPYTHKVGKAHFFSFLCDLVHYLRDF